MYKFSKTSINRLETCDKRLQDILNKAIECVDFTVICGHRGQIEQDKAFESGNSKLRFPQSKHNSIPSKAVDIAPYPINWENLNRFYHLAGIIRGIAIEKGYKIRFGGDWDMDGEISDNSFNDLVHFEIID